jgi:hypothetical protein
VKLNRTSKMYGATIKIVSSPTVVELVFRLAEFLH